MVPQRVLMGPGPSDVPARVLLSLAQPTIGHLDPVFLSLMDRLRKNLRSLFRTTNEMTLAVSATGSAGMETVFVNLIERGDRVLCGRNGVFGARMADVAERAGAEVFTVDAPWGQPIDRDAVLDLVKRHHLKIAALVHAETSTGCHTDVAGLGAELHKLDCLLILDTVTSLGGMAVEIDAWEVDAAYSGSQKCLSCPPGLSPVTLSPRAVARLEARKSKVQSWYLDLGMVKNYWGNERAYHHTAPVNMLYALDEAVTMALEEGLPARFERHRRMAAELERGLQALGCSYIAAPAHRLPMLHAVRAPSGTDEAAIRRRLLDEYGIEIGGGLGEFKGSAWRVGLMGAASSARNVRLLLGALGDLLERK